jgi:hypothetical protein
VAHSFQSLGRDVSSTWERRWATLTRARLVHAIFERQLKAVEECLVIVKSSAVIRPIAAGQSMDQNRITRRTTALDDGHRKGACRWCGGRVEQIRRVESSHAHLARVVRVSGIASIRRRVEVVQVEFVVVGQLVRKIGSDGPGRLIHLVQTFMLGELVNLEALVVDEERCWGVTLVLIQGSVHPDEMAEGKECIHGQGLSLLRCQRMYQPAQGERTMNTIASLMTGWTWPETSGVPMISLEMRYLPPLKNLPMPVTSPF